MKKERFLKGDEIGFPKIEPNTPLDPRINPDLMNPETVEDEQWPNKTIKDKDKFFPIEELAEPQDETDEEHEDRVYDEAPNDPEMELTNGEHHKEQLAEPHPKGPGFRGKEDPSFTKTWHPGKNYVPRQKLGSEEEKIIKESRGQKQNQDQNYKQRKEEGTDEGLRKKQSIDSNTQLIYSTKKKKAA